MDFHVEANFQKKFKLLSASTVEFCVACVKHRGPFLM